MPDLLVTDLAKQFAGPDGAVIVLRGLSLEMDCGEALAVVGPSGSGKSTLLHILGGLDTPSGGSVRILGTDPHALPRWELARFRNQTVGFVFQDHYLLPQCTVLENVLVPTLAAGGAGPEEEKRARGLLERVGLKERMHHRPAQISGGERQRAAVARALVNRPKLLLADEPTGNLDRKTAESVAELLLELHAEEQTLLIAVTHSLELAARFRRRAELVEGKLVEAAVS